jgi:hypothetical protein
MVPAPGGIAPAPGIAPPRAPFFPGCASIGLAVNRHNATIVPAKPVVQDWLFRTTRNDDGIDGILGIFRRGTVREDPDSRIRGREKTAEVANGLGKH